MRDGGSVPSASNGDDTFYVCADIERITEKKWKNFLRNIRGGRRPMKYSRVARDKFATRRSVVVVINDKYRLSFSYEPAGSAGR